jgi:SDR family mycofactocin-dependent oxidoreductase
MRAASPHVNDNENGIDNGERTMEHDDNSASNDKPTVTRRSLIAAAGGLVGAALASPASATAPGAANSTGRFAGRVAVITGGARGMGRTHALALAREGARIVACDILAQPASVQYPLATPQDMDETARLVRAEGGEFIGIKADVRDPQAANAVVERAMAEYGRLDFLLANAGIYDHSPLATMSDQAFDDVVRTNLYGVFHVLRAAVAPMRQGGSGRIVVTSSAAGRSGLPNGAHYSASKWAVIGLAKSLALELARERITVNCVCPTGVNTPLLNNPVAWAKSLPDDPNPSREAFEAQARRNPYTPQGVPWVEPEDVTAAVLFLLSDEAAHITGTAIDITAGGSARGMG